MSGEIARREKVLAHERQDAFGIRGALWTATSLQLPTDLAFPDYEHIGWALGRLRDMSSWALGDWILFGDAVYGERYAQAVEATGRAKGTLMNYASVARRVPPSRRTSRLAWSHHEAVAALEPTAQISWLKRAEEEGLSVEELRGLLRPLKNLTTSVDPDCGEILDQAIARFRESVIACYGDVPFEITIEPAPGAEVRVRQSGEA